MLRSIFAKAADGTSTLEPCSRLRLQSYRRYDLSLAGAHGPKRHRMTDEVIAILAIGSVG
ncbi:protein of unknown function [Pseudorhizobium banfieldiae]|uniref:Uncharacterized protein n=1 Tax=Pseudorhizobium banfieldiae TaxID=1125847 RepID=L0NKE3_9HYPH|nr:protein of unknown function [Pseudorhizobium banfieldiae]